MRDDFRDRCGDRGRPAWAGEETAEWTPLPGQRYPGHTPARAGDRDTADAGIPLRSGGVYRSTRYTSKAAGDQDRQSPGRAETAPGEAARLPVHRPAETRSDADRSGPVEGRVVDRPSTERATDPTAPTTPGRSANPTATPDPAQSTNPAPPADLERTRRLISAARPAPPADVERTRRLTSPARPTPPAGLERTRDLTSAAADLSRAAAPDLERTRDLGWNTDRRGAVHPGDAVPRVAAPVSGSAARTGPPVPAPGPTGSDRDTAGWFRPRMAQDPARPAVTTPGSGSATSEGNGPATAKRNRPAESAPTGPASGDEPPASDRTDGGDRTDDSGGAHDDDRADDGHGHDNRSRGNPAHDNPAHDEHAHDNPVHGHRGHGNPANDDGTQDVPMDNGDRPVDGDRPDEAEPVDAGEESARKAGVPAEPAQATAVTAAGGTKGADSSATNPAGDGRPANLQTASGEHLTRVTPGTDPVDQGIGSTGSGVSRGQSLDQSSATSATSRAPSTGSATAGGPEALAAGGPGNLAASGAGARASGEGDRPADRGVDAVTTVGDAGAEPAPAATAVAASASQAAGTVTQRVRPAAVAAALGQPPAGAGHHPGRPVAGTRQRPRSSGGDPEQALAAYRWRFHHETLREVVDDPDDLWDIRDRLTDKLKAAADSAARARLLGLRAVASRLLGDLDRAVADGQLALRHAEATGELRRVAIAQARLAHVLQWRGEFAVADRLFAEANSPELPDRLRATMHEHAGRSCYDQGRYIEACNHFEEALRLRRVADAELVGRTAVALDAVMARVARDGWGPYARSREEVLQQRQPPVPTLDRRIHQWGYTGPDGGPVIAARYVDAEPFHEGVAWVRRPEVATWELIDEAGRTLVGAAAGYRAVRPFSDGVAWVSPAGAGNWFAIDVTNRVAIPGRFDDVRPFRRGLAAVRRGGWGAIDRTGQVVVPLRYAGFATALTDGRYVDGFTDDGLAVVDAGGAKGVVDRVGRVIVAPLHPDLVIHPVAFVFGTRNGRWGALDRRGQPLIEPVHHGRGDVIDRIDRLLADTEPVL